MTVRLTLPFAFDCAPGRTRRVDVIAGAPLPAPMAQRFNLDRLVALAGAEGLDAWWITALRVVDGRRTIDVVRAARPIPGAVFACTAVGAQLSVAFKPYSMLTCAVRNAGTRRARLTVFGVVTPADWLFFCHDCGASVWTANFFAPTRCDRCRSPLYGGEPRSGDAAPRRRRSP